MIESSCIQADLNDQLALVRALRACGPHEVYNLASVSFVPMSWEQPVAHGRAGGGGATALLEAIREVDPEIRFYQAPPRRSSVSRSRRRRPSPPLAPLTPYGVAKAYAHFIMRSYRRRYGLYAWAGILYNHESPRRPLEFLPSKVANAVAAIKLGLSGEFWLGDLSAQRDWGYAGDYVRAMWLMLQQDEPADFVIGERRAAPVEELVERAFEHAALDWRAYVQIDESLKRGKAELHGLVGDPARRATRLAWQPEVPSRSSSPCSSTPSSSDSPAIVNRRRAPDRPPRATARRPPSV